MENKLVKELEGKSMNEIMALKNEYPFVALFHTIAAKKAKEEQLLESEEFVTSASLRVPNRKVLKEYLQVGGKKYQPKTQLERFLFAPFMQEPNFSTTNVKSSTIKEGKKLDEPDFEVELYELEEPILVEEKTSQLEEEIIDENIEVELYHYEENSIEKTVENEAVFSEEQLNKLAEKEMQRLPQENTTSENINTEEQAIQNNPNRTTVEELETQDSVYKQVVEILKQDQSMAKENNISAILLEETPVKESQEETVEEFLAKNQDFEDDYDDSDEALERLYQEAAYVQQIEQEIQEMQKQNIGAGQPNNSEQKFSFMSWLNSYSDAKTEPEAEKKIVKTEPKVEKVVTQTQEVNSTVAKEIEYQYRDSDEDLSDETSRHVQEIAMKSMQKDESFYTETLAVIYAMQEKYEQSIEVYERLAITNSEKSSYFADQIKKIKENLK